MKPLYHGASFATSAHKLFQCPTDATIEIAFAGRSNAGKSSALNCLTGNKKLARTSKTPGRTQLMNYFKLDEEGRYLVDLPGYGFAKVSRSQLNHWRDTLGQYLAERQTLACLVIVMDSRRPLTDHDWRMIDWIQQGSAELHFLLTKSDKLSRNQASATLLSTQRQLEDAGVEATLQLFSSLKKEGIDDLQGLLDSYYYRQADDNPQIDTNE